MIRLCLLILFLVVPLTASAQDAKKPIERKPNPFFAKIDANNNGSISEQEYLEQYKAQFKRMDQDNDGSVSEIEFQTKGRNRQIDRSKLKERFEAIKKERKKEERRNKREDKNNNSEAEPSEE